MASGNGEMKYMDTKGMDTTQLLSVLLEGINQINDSVAELGEALAELTEKVDNINIGGDGFNGED